MLNLRRKQEPPAPREIDLKVQINQQSTFYLTSFPGSFKDLQEMIEDKMASSTNLENYIKNDSVCVYYFDEDNEKITVSHDSDLLFLLKRLANEQINRFKIYADFEKNSGKKNSVRFEDPKEQTKSGDGILRKNDILDFCDFLKKKMKDKFSDNFRDSLKSGKIPCMECMAEGVDSSNKKCMYCHGFGERPKDSKMNLIMKIIEFKFNELLLIPFQKLLCGFSKTENSTDCRQYNDEDEYSDTGMSEEESQHSSDDCEPHEMSSESTLFKGKGEGNEVSHY